MGLVDLYFINLPAPLRSSERRKLRTRMAERFQLAPEIADTLVPDGLLTQKFSAYNGGPGVSAPGAEACSLTAYRILLTGPLPIRRWRSALVQYWEGLEFIVR